MLDYKSYQLTDKTPATGKKRHIERRDILRLVTKRYLIVLEEGQYFCGTDKAYEIEIWQEGCRVQRIPKTSVISEIQK
jgi:hypothetical protein